MCPVWNESFELELDEGYCFELALYCRGRWFFAHFLGSKKVVLPNGTTTNSFTAGKYAVMIGAWLTRS